MYTSQDYIADHQRISYATAQYILREHSASWDEYRAEAVGMDDASVDTADLIGWLGY